MGDIVSAYESYCDFVDLIANEDIVASIGMEGLNKEEVENIGNTAKNTKKRNGLIAAIEALIEGITGFFRALLGLEKDEKVSNVILQAAPGAPDINIQAIERELIRNVNLLAKTNRNSPDFSKLSAKCESLLKDFRSKADDVEVAMRKYKQQYSDLSKLSSHSRKTYEINIGRTKQNMKKLKKSAQESTSANREVIRYVEEFMTIVRAIANNTKVNDPKKSKLWSDKKAESAMKTAAKKVEKTTVEAGAKSEKLSKEENS